MSAALGLSWPIDGHPTHKAKAIGALRRLQTRPVLIRAFFADPNLRYITT